MISMRSLVVVLAACPLLASCQAMDPVPPAANAPAVAATTAPTTGPAGSATQPAGAAVQGGPVAALVNGQPIYLADIDDLLVRNYGLPVAQHLIASELVRQLAVKEGVTVDDKELREENDRAAADMFPTVASPADRQKLLDQTLSRRNFCKQQWEMVVRRNALLTKIAAKQVKVTDEDIRQAFGDTFGRKVVVRHIQCATVADAQKVLAELRKGADFAEMARKSSTNETSQSGGLLPPIGPKTVGFPPAFQDTALAMKKVGEISDIVNAGTAYHILRLEQIIEPQNVKFDDVKEKLAKDVRNAKLRATQQQLLQDLIRKARIEYTNPVLKAQAKEGQADE